MTKRKKRTTKSKKNSFNTLYLKILFLILTISFFSGLSGYFFYKKGFEDGYERASIIANKKIQSIKKEKKKLLSKLTHNFSEIKDYMQNKDDEKKEKIEKKVFFSKPKLAIIIDDMAFSYQVKELKSINLPITPSFFPPSKRHPNTPALAKKFKCYMVHLPLEAKNFLSPEEDTLLTTSSLSEIKKRVLYIKRYFPDVKYINNHTGSAFTEDKEAMKRLIKVLNENGLYFIDSRTTSKTKVKEVLKEYNKRYLARDIFLDNEQNISYIKSQLKKAVNIAKKRGYSIAIGHPHPKTFKAIKESKDILKEVELVYINRL